MFVSQVFGQIAFRNIIPFGTTGTDIIPNSMVPTNGYYDSSATGSAAGPVVSGLPAPYTVSSNGAGYETGGRESYNAGVVPSDNTIIAWRVKVLFNYGTASTSYSLIYGDSHGVAVTTQGTSVSNSTNGDDLTAVNMSCTYNGSYYTLQFDVPEPFLLGSGYLGMRFGTGGSTTGETVILYDINCLPLRAPTPASFALSGTPSTAIVGSTYNFTPTLAGGTAPVVYSISNTNALPIGLTFSTSTGAISGTPAASNLLWTPKQLGNVVLAWWDASDASTFVLSSGKVTRWNSKDPSGTLYASNSTVSQQPTYSATGRNSLPAVTFSGAQLLTMSSTASFPIGSAASSMAMVAYMSAAGSYPSLMNYGTASSGHQRAIMSVTGYGQVGVSIYGYDQSSGVSWTTDRVVYAAFNSANSIFEQVDGDTSATFTGGTMNTTAGSGALGAQPSAASFFSGTMQEALIFSRALTSSEQQSIEGYLAWRWGKQANLPSSHPYKGAAPTIS